MHHADITRHRHTTHSSTSCLPWSCLQWIVKFFVCNSNAFKCDCAFNAYRALPNMSKFIPNPRQREERVASKARIRERPLLAAKYEDCLQDFLQLTAATSANLAKKSWNFRVNDHYSRLLAWGFETGASSRQLDLSLDYSLRKSGQLRAKTAELLIDLHSTLCEGKGGLNISRNFMACCSL